jgi:hypothetical protein
MRQYLPFLLVLACPLMMFFMMRGMMGHGSHGKDDAQGSPGVATLRLDEATDTAELQQLRDDLTARLGQLDSRIEELEHEETHLTRPVRF